MAEQVTEYSSHDFGPDFEEQVLDAIILEPLFVAKFRPVMKPEAFLTENNRCLVEAVVDYFDKYGRAPSGVVLADLVRHGLFKDKGGMLARIGGASPVPDLDYVRDRVLAWAKWSAIDRVLQSHNGDTPRELSQRIDRAARTGDELISDRTSLDIDTGEEYVAGPTIPTPWAWLNEETMGGPEISDLAVILTVVSGGKTTALVNIARHALRLGKSVVYFTFEDGERKIKRRLIQSITNRPMNEIFGQSEEARRARDRFLVRYGGKCEIKQLQSRRSSVDDAAAFVRTMEDSSGRKVDVVITDYMDRFRPHLRYTEPRHGLREISEDCKWLAIQLKVVHWTARQVNKTRMGKGIVSTDSAGESWGSMESPDLVIGLGRTLEDETLDRITLFTAKVRDSRDHRTHNLITDFDRQRIFDPLEDK